MHLLINYRDDPFFNLALEEYFLCQTALEIIILWRNSPVVIVGCNQNTIEEINYDFIQKNNIAVVRRLSGGGAVFHDLGNVNFTIIQKFTDDDFANYTKFTAPVLAFLCSLGVNAKLDGRNDLTIDGIKFCGNAQTVRNGRIMHHGCILYKTDISELSAALRPKEAKFESKAVKSVRARVTNIASHIKEPPDQDVFFENLADFFRFSSNDIQEYAPVPEETELIENISKAKYSTWDWNFGSSPDYNFSKAKKFASGLVDVRFSVKKGTIEAVKIYGDYFGLLEISEFEASLLGVKHDRIEIALALRDIDLGKYIHGISLDEFLDLTC